MGTPVIASKDGCIAFSGAMGGYGKTIEITHDSQYSTLYAHNSRLLAQVGTCIKQGDTVALSGNTGLSTAPHVHFEIKKNGMPVDPNLLLNK
jgi:murein DD-endopeptidase MepM/ murein hydrolase activator NlpD